jgi:hypothetical protein
MGETVLVDHELDELAVSQSEKRTTYRGRPPTIFNGFFSKLYIAWHQRLQLMGNYRMEIKLSKSDVLRLFKCMYGRQLDADLIEQYGFTISEDLKKAVLKTVKLTDVTLGELASMTAQDAEEPSVEQPPAQVRSLFRRRIS